MGDFTEIYQKDAIYLFIFDLIDQLTLRVDTKKYFHSLNLNRKLKDPELTYSFMPVHYTQEHLSIWKVEN